jgi:short-subunit dehydrogenase
MKKAIIVGASSGIGEALARLLVENGYKVGITGRRKENLTRLKQEHPDKYFVKAFDSTNTSNAKMLDELTTELKGLDLLVISSGTGGINTELNFEIENITNQLNVVAFTEIADWAFNYFERQQQGHLAAITSIAGLRGSKDAPSYFASKAYQINYLEGLRQKAKNSKKPIYVTDIRPGFVDTAMALGEGMFWVAPVDKAVRQIYSLIKRKKEVGYVTKRWRVIAWVLKIVPGWIYKRI